MLHPNILGDWEMPVQLLQMPKHDIWAMVRGGMPVRFGKGGNPNVKQCFS